MIQALLSHHSKAHSSCGAPVRHVQMIQLPSFQTTSFFFFPSLTLFWEHSNLLFSCTFSSSPPPPSHPNPVPSLESGRPRRRHSPLGDNWHKGGLGGPGCGCAACTATGEREEESPPSLLIPSSPSSSPPPLDDENPVSAD